jgi:thiol:disulfide interchange protein DsbA
LVAADLVEGRDYATLKPALPLNDPGKIEVLEFFAWPCSHCYELHPFVQQWAVKLPADVSFVKAAVSAGFPTWVPAARAYYAFEVTGDVYRLDSAVFKAIHEQRVNLFTDANILDWAAKQGVDRAKASAALNSMTVDTKSRQAEANARAARIEGTPAIIVDGKYKLVGAASKSYADWIPLLDQLIAKARADRKAKPTTK